MTTDTTLELDLTPDALTAAADALELDVSEEPEVELDVGEPTDADWDAAAEYFASLGDALPTPECPCVCGHPRDTHFAAGCVARDCPCPGYVPTTEDFADVTPERAAEIVRECGGVVPF
jgi:hypothetical protein